MTPRGQFVEPTGLEPLEEKTPTSVYMPRFDSGTQSHGSLPQVASTPRVSDIVALENVRRGSGIDEPSVIVSAEMMVESWYDSVADTVGIVRRRRWSAYGLALIAGLSGLLAVSLGILLAGPDSGRCNMPSNVNPPTTAQGHP